MATVAAMAVREANARDRIRLAAGRIGKRLDLDGSVETPFIRDLNLRKIAELESHADFLEMADGALLNKGFSAEPGNEGAFMPQVEFDTRMAAADTRIAELEKTVADLSKKPKVK